MEMQATDGQHNSNYQKLDDSDSSSWYILSIISWILFGIIMWVSFYNGTYIWDPYQNLFNDISDYYGYLPIEINKSLPYIYTYFFLISIIGLAVYLIFTTCKKNQSLYDGMLGNISKFHIIPLLLIAALYIISINGSDIRRSGFDSDDNYYKSFRTLIIFDLIFTIIALICLIVVYITTELNCEWYIVLAIKKGVYSSFIILLLYNFFHIIVYFRLINYDLDDAKWDDERKFLKGIGIAFSILFGILSLVFSFLFKDIMAAFTTFLLYMGMVITFFNRDDEQKSERKEDFNGFADGILDIIFMILSLVCIAFLILRCRERLF